MPSYDGAGDVAGANRCESAEEPEKITGLVPESAVTHVAVRDGRWEDSETWESGEVPGDGARVHIEPDVVVTLDHQDDRRLQTLRVGGTFRVDPTVDTRLRVDTIVTMAGSRFEVGTKEQPIHCDASATIEFIDTGPLDQRDDLERIGRGIVTMGEVSIHGAMKTTWATLGDHPERDDSELELSESPTNWRAGDEIVVPGMRPYPNFQDEERTISRIDGTTVSFDQPLAHDHVPPRSELDSYVLNLSRNVQFRSEAEEIPRRAHFMARCPGSEIRYLETSRMGRTDKSRDITTPPGGRGEPKPTEPPNPNARYPIHFHRTGPATEQAHVVEGCSVHHNPGWGIVNHESRARFIGNVTYKNTGAGIVAEHGNETGLIRDNFACHSEGSGEEVDSRKGWSNAFGTKPTEPPHNIDDFGHGGHGYWSQSLAVEMEGNIAASHRHHGFAIYGRSLLEEPFGDESGYDVKSLDGKQDTYPDLPVETLNEREKELVRFGDESAPHTDQTFSADRVYSDTLPLRSFEENVAFASGGGLDVSRHQFRHGLGRADYSAISNFVAYNIGPLILEDGKEKPYENFTSSGNVGIDFRYIDNLVARNATLIGTGKGRGVYRNHAYIGSYNVVNSVIADWEEGFRPSSYSGYTVSRLIGSTLDNAKDVVVEGNTQQSSYLLTRNNTYDGDVRLYWEEIAVPNLIPSQVLRDDSGVRWEGRTVYHGWSHPDFVLVREGDTARLNGLLNHGNGQRWADALGVASVQRVREILPGKTHRQLYEQYGVALFGGFVPEGAVRPSDFEGSGGDYDSTPYLGPAPDSSQLPETEIWIDPLEMTTVQGAANRKVVAYGDDGENLEPLRWANDQKALQLNRGSSGHSLPVAEDTPIVKAEFDVSESGPHSLHMRVQAAYDPEKEGGGRNRNRIFLRVNGGDWQLWEYFGSPRDLAWDDPRGTTTYNLPEGTNTLEIAGTGRKMRLDRILVKHETSAANPIGKGKPHTPQ